MFNLTRDYIRKQVAYSDVIYQRGFQIYSHGAYNCIEADPARGHFVYEVDGAYGDYTTSIRLADQSLDSACDCPYPNDGCKHTVAVVLDVKDRLSQWKNAAATRTRPQTEALPEISEAYLTPDEIREQAIDDRRKRARSETFQVTWGDMFKGVHLLETPKGRQYEVTLHDPIDYRGHCTCPDFLTNRLGICKHLMYLGDSVKKEKNYAQRLGRERFPFVDIFWDSVHACPRLFCERPASEIADIQDDLAAAFGPDGLFSSTQLDDLLPLLARLHGNKRVRVQEPVLQRLDDWLQQQQLEELARSGFPAMVLNNAHLYPYQEEGIKFALYKKAALIGDEMGLGKTLQAIMLAVLKREVFGFERVLVVTLASLKEQWQREIERFSSARAVIVAGSARQREAVYEQDTRYFKITNYESVLRDVTILSRFAPDLVILDEAQRIKNFNTKTAEAVKSIPRKHCLVLTGTPLENKLEDIYSIVQFLDPYMLSPLWQFAANHFMLSRDKKGKILGYRNLEALHQKLQAVVIRRRKEEVLSELPEEVVNNYYLELTAKQQKLHTGYMQGLLPLLNKKFLTPMDLRRIQELLLRMRMVCDSTYLIDRKTNISPKLKELESILDELVIQNRRKVVIFSEWTTMTFLIAKHLSEVAIPFVELSGKIPVPRRQALIDEFTNNPDCKVFLSTDAGGTGLNLQAADCVINFELPWSPARLNQRIGRVNRIGQKSGCINVVNFITKNSIEEKILAGIQLKTDLFKGVFDGGLDVVEFSSEKRTEMLNQLRAMMGEEPALPVREASAAEEIPEDTPHYLNPQVLEREDSRIAYDAEESPSDAEDAAPQPMEAASPDPDTIAAAPHQAPSGSGGHGHATVLREEATNNAASGAAQGQTPSSGQSIFAGQTPEKVEEVLNAGMAFIGGLLEMATNQKIKPAGADQRMIRIDRQSGEVTMTFKLPVM